MYNRVLYKKAIALCCNVTLRDNMVLLKHQCKRVSLSGCSMAIREGEFMYKRVLMVVIFAVGLLSHFALANEMKAPVMNKEMASMGNAGSDMMAMSMNNHQHHHMDNMGMWMFNVMPMYMNMDGLQSGTNSVSGSSSDMMVPKSMNMYMLMFMAMYMRGDWSVMLMNSYNIKTI